MKEIEVQTVLESDIATILALHQQRLGWIYLLESTIADREVGFPCEKEEFLIRRQLKGAVEKVSEWFETMGRQNNWPSINGLVWEIDFKLGQAIPKKQNLQPDKTKHKQEDRQNGSLIEGPVMTLGEIDFDIIKCLLEERGAIADYVRSRLRFFLKGDFTIDELSDMVQKLGAANIDVINWFSKMAAIYKWPQMEDNSWLYRVDMAEKQVYLIHRGRCSCF